MGVLALDLVDNRLLIFYRGGFLQAKAPRASFIPNSNLVLRTWDRTRLMGLACLKRD